MKNTAFLIIALLGLLVVLFASTVDLRWLFFLPWIFLAGLIWLFNIVYKKYNPKKSNDTLINGKEDLTRRITLGKF